MYCLSINYKNAGVEIRQRFSFSQETRRELLKKLVSAGSSEAVVLCTCNRTELYFSGDGSSCTEPAAAMLAEFGGADVRNVSPYLRTYYEGSANVHLFRVACGIDSMVIGEDEILGQVKGAYMESSSLGYTGFELNTVFQAAIACAKRIKTETALSKSSVSVATLAANEAAAFGENVNVLVIGATGNIGSVVLKNLVSHRNIKAAHTVRRHNELYGKISSADIESIDYAERYDNIDRFDCVISATSGPHYTITYSELIKHVSGGAPRLFIDLAVPPDIEGAVSEIAGVRLIGIDHFRKLAEENNSIKLSSKEQAKEIIYEELDELNKKLAFHSFLPYMEQVKERTEKLSFEEMIYKLKAGLSSEQFSAVLEVFRETDGEE